MNDDSLRFENTEDELILRTRSRDANNGRPSTFDPQELARRKRLRKLPQKPQVVTDALVNLRADRGAALEQGRGGYLHRSTHRKKTVGDQFETGECPDTRLWRTACDEPRQFQLRQSDALGQAA